MSSNEKYTATPYDLDGRPPLGLAIPLGLQHVLAMFVGNLTPLLIITGVCGIEAGGSLQIALLQNAMLIAGIVTLVQVLRSGRLEGSFRLLWEPAPVLSVCAEVSALPWEAASPHTVRFWLLPLSAVCLKRYWEAF